jgi:hypothetical protein
MLGDVTPWADTITYLIAAALVLWLIALGLADRRRRALATNQPTLIGSGQAQRFMLRHNNSGLIMGGVSAAVAVILAAILIVDGTFFELSTSAVISRDRLPPRGLRRRLHPAAGTTVRSARVPRSLAGMDEFRIYVITADSSSRPDVAHRTRQEPEREPCGGIPAKAPGVGMPGLGHGPNSANCPTSRSIGPGRSPMMPHRNGGFHLTPRARWHGPTQP